MTIKDKVIVGKKGEILPKKPFIQSETNLDIAVPSVALTEEGRTDPCPECV